MSSLATLRNRVEANIAEPITATGWFTPSAVNNWINAGTEMVFLKIVAANPDYFGVKSTTLSYVANTQEYSLSSVNPFEIRQVEVTDLGSPYYLEEAEKTLRDTVASPGEPESYYWNVDYENVDPILEVGFIPTPDRTASNNVRVYYVPRPRTLVNDTDTSDLPQEFQELIILWATILALRADQRPEAAWQNEFNFRMINMLGFANRGRSGGPTYVHYVED